MPDSVVQASNSTETLAAAQLADPVEVKERFYTLVYRRGAQVKEKNFPFAGKLDGAIARGREHCRKMKNIRFVVVRPFIVDLDYQEEVYAISGRSPDDETV